MRKLKYELGQFSTRCDRTFERVQILAPNRHQICVNSINHWVSKCMHCCIAVNTRNHFKPEFTSKN